MPAVDTEQLVEKVLQSSGDDLDLPNYPDACDQYIC